MCNETVTLVMDAVIPLTVTGKSTPVGLLSGIAAGPAPLNPVVTGFPAVRLKA